MSSTRELLIDGHGTLLRAAVLNDGRLTDLHIDPIDGTSFGPQTGSIWRGRVERLSTGLNAAFIDLGTGKSGLLGLADIRLPGGARAPNGSTIGTLLRCGQPVTVQVKAEAFGTKGPTLAMEISLPGRFLVHAPFRRGVALSKRVGQGAVRAALAARLQNLTVGDGWIARSGTESVSDDVRIAEESESLALCWRDLERRAAEATAPACLLPGPDATRRAVIGLGPRPLTRVMIDSPDRGATFTAWCLEAARDLMDRIQVHAGPEALFEHADLEGAIAALARPHAPLSNGGGLVIERTEALTAIDVNAGERGNPLAVNLEAADEIARQLRLRNIGGIIVVDFLSMPRRDDGPRVLDRLAAAVRDDPVQTEVYEMSKLGLVELTRARRGPALSELPGFQGSGFQGSGFQG
ncbi:MAG: ribonuclease E/G [Rhodospirillaceae bacterium]